MVLCLISGTLYDTDVAFNASDDSVPFICARMTKRWHAQWWGFGPDAPECRNSSTSPNVTV